MAQADHEHFVTIDVSETDQNRAFWVDQEWAKSADRTALVGADLLVVPEVRDGNPSFPEGSADIIERLRSLMPEQRFEVAVDEDGYQELALYGKAWRLPSLLITSLLLPTLAGLFSTRLDEIIPGHKDGDTVEVSISIESANRRVLRIATKGSAQEITEILAKVPEYIRKLENVPRGKHQQ